VDILGVGEDEMLAELSRDKSLKERIDGAAKE